MRKTKSSPPQPERRRPSRAVWWGLVFLAAAIGMLLWQLIAPDSLERAVGEVKVAVQEVAQEVASGAGGPQHPVIRLGGEGDRRALDRCDGTFIEMVSYRMTDVPPVYAAHNNCGGDVILSWQLGDTVRIDGRDALYTVVEERHTPKWSMVTKLRGMAGELVVQTCYYGQDRMRFLALAPVTPEAPRGARPMLMQ